MSLMPFTPLDSARLGCDGRSWDDWCGLRRSRKECL